MYREIEHHTTWTPPSTALEAVDYALERDESIEIRPEWIETCRAAGLLIHYEPHPVDPELDAWYAATPNFVRRYHASGGVWAYVD